METGHAFRSNQYEQPDAEKSEHDTDCAADEPQGDAFQKELARESHAVGTHGGS